MPTKEATREELLDALAEVALRAERYRWLLLTVCPWAVPLVYYGEAIEERVERRIQDELDRKPERRPPLVLTPEQAELEF